MRYVYGFSRHVPNLNRQEVKGVADARHADPQRVRSPLVAETELERESRLQPPGGQGMRSAAAEERRRVSQRVIRQSVLVEFRSGIDRRRRNLRESDIVEHVDLIA